MAQPYSYWVKKWDKSEYQEDAFKALDLLHEYAGFFKHLPIIGSAKAWGGAFGRFFSGRWNTTHGEAVQNAIAGYYNQDCYDRIEKSAQTVAIILAKIKNEIKDSVIKSDGDLATIFKVIKEKTTIDYYTLDAREALKDYQRNRQYI